MNQQNKTYKVLGIMSGTSFDGIDLCIAQFFYRNNQWSYKILNAETLPYDIRWKDKIKLAETTTGESLIKLHFEYGHYLGKLASNFIHRQQQSVDFIASHGHTLFHQIENGFTFQLGHGASIAASSKLLTVSDFRSLDVALGGQGAPLVPIGDKLLFSQYDSCVNLGGIANISYELKGKRIAYDVAAANMVLNYLCQNYLQIEFDKDGQISEKGKLNESLFNRLNEMEFYTNQPPKSLGKEWVYKHVIPKLEQDKLAIEDLLHTYSLHLVYQLKKSLKIISDNGLHLITGGGAKNKFLMKELAKSGLTIEKPDTLLIDFKEALIFAFLGVLRFINQENTLKDVTGALKNSSGGTIYRP